METGSSSTLDIVIDPGGAVSGGQKVQQVVQSLKTGFLDLSAKVYVAQAALNQAWTMAKRGAEFEETMSRLNRQMGVFHGTANQMVGDIQRITQGTVNMGQAAQMASRGLSIGFDPSQMEAFTRAARLLKEVMGNELPQAFDEIAQAAITGRSTVLGNIGIFVDLTKEADKLAVATGRTSDQITKQERSMIAAKAVMAQIGEAEKRLTDGVMSDADRLRAVEARWEEMWTKMGQGAKTMVVGTLDWMGKLQAGIEASAMKEMAPRIKAQREAPGNIDNPDFQSKVLGPSIVASATGRFREEEAAKLARAAEEKARIPPLPTAIRAGVLDAEAARRQSIRQQELERDIALYNAKATLLDTNARLSQTTAVELTQAKGALQLQELAKTGEVLSQSLAAEVRLNAAKRKIGFDSTEEKIAEEQRFAAAKTDLDQKLKTNAQAFSIAAAQSAANNRVAEAASQEELGRQIVERAQSTYAIQEQLRQRDLQDTETYYKGEFDMADARFASDVEIAQKERELLRSQLAFKLRLTEEEVERLLFLRKAGDFEGVRQIAGRGDANLSDRAKEGIVESGAAADVKLAERANDDFFRGWARGLQKYSKDRDSAFGMSQQMAQRTAQAMEQGFQRFFFDFWDQKVTSMKDVMKGLLDFTKVIVSQMMAQFATMAMMRGVTGLAEMFMGGGMPAGAAAAAARGAADPSLHGPGFASGGMGDFGRGTLATLHGKEAIVPLPDGKRIPVQLQDLSPPRRERVEPRSLIQVTNVLPPDRDPEARHIRPLLSDVRQNGRDVDARRLMDATPSRRQHERGLLPVQVTRDREWEPPRWRDPQGPSLPEVPAAASTSGRARAIVSMPVTIYNNAAQDTTVETRQSQSSSGQPQLEVMVSKLVDKALTRGRLDKTMRSRYGLTPGER